MSTTSSIKEAHRKEYELMRLRPIGIIFPIVNNESTKCLAYEVYEADGTLRGISYISFSKQWFKPSGDEHGNKWFHMVEEEDGYSMRDDLGNHIRHIMTQVMSLIDSVVVETEILGFDLKLD